MSRKDNLKKRIDALCQELGISDVPYRDTSTETQLNTMIDELEAKLPGEDESDDEITQDEEAGPETQTSDIEDHAGGESNEAANPVQDQTEVLVGVGDFPPGASLNDERVPQAKVNDEGLIQVKVLSSFQCQVGDHPKLLKVGEEPYLDEDTAMEAVEAGVAVIIATL
ncbi:hypothetical protein [Photobacterium atrarenae]|uniref:Uncharacterized protein n=1 Tax=Photobacterium atrarenae TaxID=865757 RepID=A0ABY5GIN0_9GAMM|nr:hypothetical protein [Photobacterium atrarenae]UTV28995.1 hypothetical protein NNL38_07130 [Photobacterium atrarenae]